MFAAAPLVNLGVGVEMLAGVVGLDSDGVVTGLAAVTGVAVTKGVVRVVRVMFATGVVVVTLADEVKTALTAEEVCVALWVVVTTEEVVVFGGGV
jgi:hypothetical protein